jgi:transposase
MVLHAIDGTRIRAQASTETSLHRKKLEEALKKIDADIDDLEKQFKNPPDANDQYTLPEDLEDAEERRRRIRESLDQLDQEEAKHLQPAETDARMMKVNGRKEFGYNGQAVVEKDKGFVVAADVTNSAVDTGQLGPMLDQVKDNLGECAKTTVADAGYSGGDDLASAEDKSEIIANISKNVLPPEGTKPFHSSRFTYNPERDVMICPLGQILVYQRMTPSKNKKHKLRVFHCKQWRECAKRDECSSNNRGRTVQIPEHQEAIDNHKRRHEDPEKVAMLKMRGAIVEPLFGHVKERLKFRKWTLRTIDGVKTQWALLCLTLNLEKLFQIWLKNPNLFAH